MLNWIWFLMEFYAIFFTGWDIFSSNHHHFFKEHNTFFYCVYYTQIGHKWLYKKYYWVFYFKEKSLAQYNLIKTNKSLKFCKLHMYLRVGVIKKVHLLYIILLIPQCLLVAVNINLYFFNNFLLVFHILKLVKLRIICFVIVYTKKKNTCTLI